MRIQETTTRPIANTSGGSGYQEVQMQRVVDILDGTTIPVGAKTVPENTPLSSWHVAPETK